MKIRLFTILLLFIGVSNLSKAQEVINENNSGEIGITYSSFGENDVIRFVNLTGSAGYYGINFFTIGINYTKPLNNWLELETGIEYSKHNIQVNPNLPPDMDNSPYSTDLSLMNIPISMRANFLKYFYINGGIILDLEVGNSNPIDEQTGFGGLLGIAIKYDFDFGAAIFLNPYIKAHSLIPFSFENYHQRIMESGIRFGIAYDLNKLH